MNEIIRWAEERPLFRFKEAEREFDYGKEYLKVKLHRLAKKNELKRIEKGKYTVHEDPMIYASHIETPSFLSLWTALRYYNLTTQQPTKVHIITSKEKKDLDNIKFHSTKKSFGYSKKIYKGFQIFVADKERLLLDCLKYRTVPTDELDELIKEVEPGKTIEYTLNLENKALNKRVGYLLEKKTDTSKKTGEKLEELHQSIDRNYTVLDLSKPNKGEKNSRWRIKVNTDAA